MIKVGLLGAGGIGRHHASRYGQIENARLVAVADIDRVAAGKLAKEYGTQVYYTMESLLDDPDIDMVDVCLPTFLHEQAVVAAARAGKHVLCEKPVALTMAGVERMIEAVDRAGVKCMVAQVIRFWPQYAEIKALLDRGELGRPLMAHAARLGCVPALRSWYGDPGLSGGALLDLHVHDLDYLYQIFGKPTSVYALGLATENGAWNQVLTSLDYGDKKAAAEASFLMPNSYPFGMSLRLLGDKGCAEYACQGEQRDLQAPPKNELVIYPCGEPARYHRCCPERDAYLAEIEYFVDCVAQDTAPKSATLTEAREVLEVAMAARRSLETGQVVIL